MAVYAIADLHLSLSSDKPMDIFGSVWQNHPQILSEHWRQTVRPEDTVVLIGDHSWALRLEEVIPDLQFIHQLPGRKILLKGNHDLWWPTARKLEELCRREQLTTLSFLQADAMVIPDGISTGIDAVLCGTRGWICPGDREFSKKDEPVYRRESMRLETALRAAHKWESQILESGRQAEIIAFLHYPPFGNGGATAFTDLLEKYKIRQCFYGHLHGIRSGEARITAGGACVYTLVSGDYLSFRPVRLSPFEINLP